MTIFKKTIYHQTILLCMAMLTGGFISLHLGKELGWDLAHYHYYGGFAFLDQRVQDFWAVSYIHQFINPTIDLFPYFLLNTVTPRWCEFILGALHGINFWLLFLIADEFLDGSFIVCLL